MLKSVCKWVISMLYQNVTEDVTTFSTFNTWSSCTGWYFTEQTNALLNSNQKRKKKGLKALLFGASKELQGWQHSAWQCDMVAQREHRAMISLSPGVISGVIFFLPVCWMLHFYTASLLVSWQRFDMPIFFLLLQDNMLIGKGTVTFHFSQGRQIQQCASGERP